MAEGRVLMSPAEQDQAKRHEAEKVQYCKQQAEGRNQESAGYAGEGSCQPFSQTASDLRRRRADLMRQLSETQHKLTIVNELLAAVEG